MAATLSATEPPRPDAPSADALQRYLAAHPEADTDRDGVLSELEYAGYLPRSLLEVFDAGGRHVHAMAPMRDGTKLATEILLPAGDGPWPVVLMRTPYGRWNTAGYAKRYADKRVAFVVQDLRGSGDSEGRGTFDPLDFSCEISDSYDTVEWLAAQPWCDGRVGMTGGSGHGMAAAMAYWSRAPHLVVTAPGNTAGHGLLYWLSHNGVRRWSYSWISHRGGSAPSWPRPTVCATDFGDWHARTREAAKDNGTVYVNDTGWYDTFLQGALDDFAAISAAGGRAFVTVSPRGHGGISGLSFPSAVRPASPPALVDLLTSPTAAEQVRSTLVYYLMGDVRDPAAPGNGWRVTHTWPPPHEDLSLYLDGTSLERTAPTSTSERSYRYDPARPAPSLGGHYAYEAQKSGPHDQRPLLVRDDVLLFATEVLQSPLVVTGRLSAELFISSDASDTLFVVKLVDIYPDGYHALVRESAGMARFSEAGPRPLRRGEVRRLNIDLWSTAYVFNRGHRIGVMISSSSDPAYEVHPNCYEPVSSADAAVMANNTVHCSPVYRSRIVLPVVTESAR